MEACLMANDESPIRVEDHGGVRTITLHRPDVLNALNAELLTVLGASLRQAQGDAGVRCLIVTGAGRAFSAGQDLDVVRDRYRNGHPIDFEDLLHTYYHPVIMAIRTMEKPIIAAVNGVAAGAGCSLALACDLRVVAESASFIQAFINVGLIPDAGSTFMLPRLIGVSRAMEMAFTGRKIPPDEALRIGLVNQVVADSDLASATNALAGKLATIPTRAIGLAKRAINASWTADLDAQLALEARTQNEAARTTDHPEGVEAFLEKRPPRFIGQ
jgi:2-(1,2-epoxy-1,2-dihydrophenyl)acetyl-CoA isomerase